jgi:hypothetical protein
MEDSYSVLTEPSGRAVRRRKRFLFLAAGLIFLALAFSAGGLLGAIAGESAAKQRRFAYEGKVIAPILHSDPAFMQLEIVMYTGDGSAYLMGEVATNADRERLRAAMTDLLGSAREVEPLAGVCTVGDPSGATERRSRTY